MATADYPRDAQFPLHPPANTPNDAVTVLQRNLARLAVRRNKQRMWQAVVQATTWGVGAAALLVLAYRFYLIDGEWWVPLLVIGAALIIGYRNGLLRHSGPFDAALDADRSLGLQERLSSALAFIQPDAVRRQRKLQTGTSWASRLGAILLPRIAYETAVTPLSTQLVPALVQDAAARSAEVDPKKLYPTTFDRSTKLLVLFTTLLAIFCLMPNIQWFRTAEQRKLATVLQQQGKELEAIAKVVHDKKETEQDPQTKELSRRLSALARKLQRGRMTKRTALVEMGQLHKDLEQAAQNKQQNSSANMQQMEQELRNQQMESPEGQKMQEELARKNYEAAAKQLEKMADRLQKGDIKPQEGEKMAKDLEKAAEALRKQGGQQNEQAAKQLEQAAQGLRQQNQQSKQGQNGQQNQQNQQNGQQGQQGQQQKSNSQAQAGAASALRQMAQGLRQNASQSGNSQGLRDMLQKIQQAEKDTGQNNSSQSGDKPCPKCGKYHPGGT